MLEAKKEATLWQTKLEKMSDPNRLFLSIDKADQLSKAFAKLASAADRKGPDRSFNPTVVNWWIEDMEKAKKYANSARTGR